MGLDVYLYHEENREEIERLSDLSNKIDKELWEKHFGPKGTKYDSSTDGAKNEYRAERDKAYLDAGLDHDGGIPAALQQCIEERSRLHPEHYFKIGYFRSSYNSGGINSVMHDTLGMGGLYDIFGDSDEYIRRDINWKDAREKALMMKEAYKNHLLKAGGFSIAEVRDPLSFYTAKEAIETFLSEKESWENGRAPFGGRYSSAKGDFFPEGITVYGVMAGKSRIATRTTYLIIKGEPEKDEDDFYLQALDIVVETCDYVLSKPDPEKYVLHWSA